MVSRVKPEHQAPIETFGRITCTFIRECLPHIGNRRNDAIVNMCRGGSRISGLSKSADQFSWLDKIHYRAVDCVKVEILMDPPLRSEHKHALACFARHFLGIDYETACLGGNRCPQSTKNIDSGVRVTGFTSSPWPMPEALMVIVCRSAAWHSLSFWNQITNQENYCHDNEYGPQKSLHFATIY